MQTLCKNSFLKLLKSNIRYVGIYSGDQVIDIARLDHLKITYRANQEALDALTRFRNEPVYFGNSQKVLELSLEKKA